MDTVASTPANITTKYHEINDYFVFRQTCSLASKYFENSWFRFLEDCQLLLNINLIKITFNIKSNQ